MLRSWPIWSLGFVAIAGGVGVMSAISLFRIPNLPNCRAIFWPTASAATRMQCAEAYADQGTVAGYLDAINLIKALPADHPLRFEINQDIEAWSNQILDLAENTFQAGQLPEAIAIARQIPDHTAAATVVSQRINHWQQIWQDATDIYAKAEADLNNLEFQDAFSQATKLLSVDNTFWKTDKYNQLTNLITAAREDLNTLGQAKRLAKQRTLDSLKQALNLAQGIDPNSPLHNESRNLIRSFSWDLLALAESALDQRDAVTARGAIQAIPAAMNMGQEIADMSTMIDASQLSWQGGTVGLEGAIVRLQSIGQDRPLYARSQALMRRWQAEVEGRSQLEWARQIAAPGTPADLQAAIAEANQIARTNPAWDDAQAQIKDWRRQIQTTQDRPILIQADQLAQTGDLAGAIALVQQIAPGRALYDEANQRAKGWRAQIQEQEDRPKLAQARQLANAGQFQEAIQIASEIGANRSLYQDAQQDIQTWRNTVKGQQRLQDAYRMAQQGTAQALAQAIEIAQQIPDTSPEKTAANQAMTGWSWDIVRLAETEAEYNLARAIEIAAAVPARTEAYAQAQLLLKSWRQTGAPASTVPANDSYPMP